MQSALLLFVVLIAGASSLVYELASTEILFFFFPESGQTVAVVLAIFLFGLFTGALFTSKITPRFKDSQHLFSLLQMGAGISVLLLSAIFFHIPALTAYLYNMGNENSFVPRVALGTLLLLLPSFFFGSSFAAIVDEYMGSKKRRLFGTIYAVDVLGAVAGVLITGFLLFPSIGVMATSAVCSGLNFLASALAAKKKHILFVSSVLLIIAVMTAVIFLSPREQKFSIEGKANLKPFNKSKIQIHPCDGTHVSKIKPSVDPNADILLSENSPYGLVFITTAEENTFLWIGRAIQCGTGMPVEYNLGANTANLLADNSTVMNIGLGCGFTLQGILLLDKVKEVDVVEINPVVPSVSSSCFWRKGYSPIKDNRTTIYLDDAAHYLLVSTKKYDAIVMDIQNPAVIHSSPLYTKEYFQLMKASLNEGGILSIYGYNFEGGRPIIYETLETTFKYVYYLKDEPSDIYYASDKPLSTRALKMTEEDINETERLNSTPAEINTLQKPVLKYIIMNPPK